MTDTLLPDYPRGITFEDVWAALKETDRMMKETDLRMKETDRRMKETDRRMKETDRRMEKTDRQISKLGSRFGELVEHLVGPNIMSKFNDLDFNFTRCSTNVIIKEHGNPNAVAEVDIMLENGDIVIAIEVKAKPENDDVKDHIYRMEKLRKAADLRHDKRRYQGAIAAAIINDNLRSYILKQGFYLIEQTGDTVHINIAPGFSPREW